MRTEHVAGIALLSRELLLVRVASRQRVSAESTEWLTTHRHYLIDPETGMSLGGFEAAHAVLGGGHGRAVLYHEAPYPRFTVVTVQ
jgi:hypothetical protein